MYNNNETTDTKATTNKIVNICDCKNILIKCKEVNSVQAMKKKEEKK